jgi:DNA invertase Pin-like site-specific DNA recombinase
MKDDSHHKVTGSHLERQAYLYIRQSTLHQVVHNTESTRRQYDLRGRALSLGWRAEQIVVLDGDQGQSAATADRAGFQMMVAEVGMGRVGLVMGLEVSRLARNSADWHGLLEICALRNTLILDEDGLYNPATFNDRLLLGMKGTISEAELYMIRTRLQGGLINKAKRGDLRIRLPVGLVYNDQGEVVLEPDTQVQEAIRLLFKTFRRVGTILGTAKEFCAQNLLFPRRLVRGPRSKAPVVWRELDYSAAWGALKNARYAGVYVHGQTRQRKGPDGRYQCERLPPEEWNAWIPDAHVGYITLAEYEENQRRIQENARACGADRRSPPREGRALLQGLVLCGRCFRPMTVHYARRRTEMIPIYVCTTKEGPMCQSIHGGVVDAAIGELVCELMTPMALEVSLVVQQELQQRWEETEKLRRKQVEGARYEADLARQRYMQVDPNNRHVADTLEEDWEEKLGLLRAEQEEFERRAEADRKLLSDEEKSQIMALASDFPRLWNDPQTPCRERKRMLRLLVEDVTLGREADQIVAHVRFKGGTTKSLTMPRPKTAAELRKADPELVAEIDRLLDHHTDAEIASQFNERGILSPTGLPFKRELVNALRRSYGLKARSQRLREAGCMSLRELAAKLHVGTKKLKRWEAQGLLKSHAFDENRRLYEVPTSIPSEEDS